MIFPNFYRLFRDIKKDGTINVTFVLYHNERLIFTGEIKDIAPANLEDLEIFLNELMRINNSQEFPLKFGIYEISIMLEEYKK